MEVYHASKSTKLLFYWLQGSSTIYSMQCKFTITLWAVHCEACFVKLPEVDEMKELLNDRMRQTRQNFPYSHRRGFYDYFLRPPRCDYTYGVDLVKDCGLENRLASFWCHPADIWSFTSNFSAVLTMPIRLPNTSTTDIEFHNEKMPLALI